MPYLPTRPVDITETQELLDWVERELTAISKELTETTAVELRPVFVEPSKPREGMVVYADGVEWDPGSGEGPYVYMNGAWVPLFSVAAEVSGFFAKGTGQTVTVNTPVVVQFATEVDDVGSDFASNTYTAPVNGYYAFEWSAFVTDSEDADFLILSLAVNGTDIVLVLSDPLFGTAPLVGAVGMELAAGNTVTVRIKFNNKTGVSTAEVSADGTWFSGHLVFAT